MSLNLKEADESILCLPEHERSRAERDFLTLAALYREAVEMLDHVGKCSACAKWWGNCEKGLDAVVVLAKAREAGVLPG